MQELEGKRGQFFHGGLGLSGRGISSVSSHIVDIIPQERAEDAENGLF